jgi:hypothetical protein
MMLASRYVALGHKLPTSLPPELRERRERLLFARWLVLTGRLSDWEAPPDGRAGRAGERVPFDVWRRQAAEEREEQEMAFAIPADDQDV